MDSFTKQRGKWKN